MKFILALLLFAVVIKSLIWTFTLPIFQTPDEQAHFAQLQWYAENKSLNVPQKNLSQEVAMAEKLLGTKRDERGNNLFTYHQDFKLGTWDEQKRIETEIGQLAKESRIEYVGSEAAMYPPLYYLLDLPFYYLGDAGMARGLAVRVMTSRMLSVICHLLLVICAYFIGRQIWKEKIKGLILATVIGFQPMVSFVAGGIHPDNLLNLFFSVEFLVLLLVLKNGVRLRYLVALAVVGFLGVNTKQLAYLFFPVVAAVVGYSLFKRRPVLGLLVGILALLSPLPIFLFQIPMPFVPFVTPTSPLAGMGIVDYLRFRIPKMMFEVWPWFWGVFKWLGVTLPPITMKVITRVSFFAGVGLVLHLFGVVRKRKFDFETKAIVLSFFSLLSYISYLLLWDWRLMQSAGFSQGIQGRYFFPNIVPIFILFLCGLFHWEKFFGKFKNFYYGLMIVGAILLNGIGLHTVLSSLY